MIEYPVIFSGPMVRSILSGSKTQARMLPSPLWDSAAMHIEDGDPVWLWVRPLDGAKEPLLWASRLMLGVLSMRLERLQDISHDDALAEGIQRDSSAFMQAGWWHYGGATLANGDPANVTTDPRLSFAGLWDRLHHKPGKTWADNPEVWRIEVRRTSQ
ncbi:MAG: hypothetical protein ACREF4_03620 [Gammaproteobacteria bacterium]